MTGSGLAVAGPARPDPARRAAVWLASGVLLVQAGLLAWSATLHSPTWDEVGHLPAGISHWRSGCFDAYRVNPPLVRLGVTWPAVMAGADIDWRVFRPEPWHRTEFDLGHAFIVRHAEGSLWHFKVCRWAAIPFAVLGGWVCFAWGRRLHGDRGGLAAVTLWATSPNVLAHAQLITPDTAASAFGAFACFAFWNWLNGPTWPKAIATGTVLGAALLTKFTLLVFPLLWLGVWAWCCLRVQPASRSQVAQLVTAFLISLYVVNVGYAFEDTLRPLGRFEFVSQDLAGEPTGRPGCPDYGNRFTGTWLGRIPVPVPANYLMGMDVQRRDFELGMNSYLRGEWRKRGWWYYYLYALVVKEPVGTLILVGLACGTVFRRRPQLASDLVPLVFGVGVIAFVSSQTGFNHHLRYVLPALPLLYVFAGRVFAAGQPRWLVTVGVCCVLGTTASSLRAYPHSMSYFNELAGGGEAGPRHLHNSNLDWGQDLLFLKRWCDEHPDRRPLYIVFAGGFDTNYLRFWGDGVYHTFDPATDKALAGEPPGPKWFALFVGRLFDPVSVPDPFIRFRGREPDERLTDTIYIYQDGASRER